MMTPAKPTRQESIQARLAQRPSLRSDDELRSLAAAIDESLSPAPVDWANAVNYAAWQGLTGLTTPVDPSLGAVRRAVRWLGLTHDTGPTTTMQSWEAIVADCVAYVERKEVEQPLDLESVIVARTGVDVWLADGIKQDVLETYQGVLDANPTAGPSDQAAMLWWVASKRLREVIAPEKPPAVEPALFWAGEVPPSAEVSLPTWEPPPGDGMESLRIHPSVAQAIDRWIASHPLTSSHQETDVGDPVDSQVTIVARMLDSASWAIRDAYQSAFAPSRLVPPASHFQQFARRWLVLLAVCLSVTTATGIGTWRVMLDWFGTPTFVSTFTWAIQIMSLAAGFLLVCSALSVGLSILWTRFSARIRLRGVRVAVGTALSCSLIWLAPWGVRHYIVVNPSDYLLPGDHSLWGWWQDGIVPLVTSVVLGALILVCAWGATGLTDDWHRFTHKPNSLADALGHAHVVLSTATAALEEFTQQGIPAAVPEADRTGLNHLNGLVNRISATTTPRLITPLDQGISDSFDCYSRGR